MALADSVPGVSGGTIAFLLGFYDSFINSLNDIMGRDNAKRKKAFFFLIKLGVGWVIGMLLAVSVLANVFESGIYKVSSLFLGFIILAIPVMIMEEKESIKGKYYNIVWAVIGIAIVVGISLINPSGSGADVSHMNRNSDIRCSCRNVRNICNGASRHFRLHHTSHIRSLYACYHGNKRVPPFEFRVFRTSLLFGYRHYPWGVHYPQAYQKGS